MALWRSWLARRPVTAEVAGSSPVRVALGDKKRQRKLALLSFSVFSHRCESGNRELREKNRVSTKLCGSKAFRIWRSEPRVGKRGREVGNIRYCCGQSLVVLLICAAAHTFCKVTIRA